MTIRKTIFSAFGAIFFLNLVLLLLGAHHLLQSEFDRLERETAERAVLRLADELDDLLSHIRSIAGDWANSEATARFAEGKNSTYLPENFSDGTLSLLQLHSMLFFDPSGRLLAAKCIDTATGAWTPTSPSLMEALYHKRTQWRPRDSRAVRTGVLLLPEGALLVVASPINRPGEKDAVLGALVLGRSLDKAELRRLGALAGGTVSIWSLQDPLLPEDGKAADSKLSQKAKTYTRELGENTLAGYTRLQDFAGGNGLVLRVERPRDLHLRARQTVRYAALCLVGLGLILAATIALVLERVVLKPLEAITGGVSRLWSGNAVPISLPTQGAKELSQLAQAVNDMVSREMRKSEALRQSEEQYRGLLTACPDPVIVYDSEGRTTYINDAFVDVYGWTREDVVGQRLDSFIPPEERDRCAVVWGRILSGEKLSFETTRFTKDVRRVHVQITSACLNDSQGKHVASIVIHRDVTEQRRAEEQQHRAEEEQKRLERALFHAQRLQSVGVLAGGIAHDFNNILTPIIGFTEQAIDDLPEGTRVRGNLERVLTAATRAKNLVWQILAFSRENEDEVCAFRVTPIVKETLQLLRASLPSTIEIRSDFRAGADAIQGNPSYVHQIVMNLGTNAGQAMEPRGGVLDVVVEVVDLNSEEGATRYAADRELRTIDGFR